MAPWVLSWMLMRSLEMAMRLLSPWAAALKMPRSAFCSWRALLSPEAARESLEAWRAARESATRTESSYTCTRESCTRCRSAISSFEGLTHHM